MELSSGGLPARARLALTGAALAGLCALGASDALATSGTTYYASASSTASSPCTQAAPCRLDHALAAAGTSGDTVIVEPGTYAVSYGTGNPHGITIEGEPGQAWPTLIGASNLGGPVLTTTTSTVQDLVIESESTAGAHPPALDMTGGTAQDLILSAGAADTQGEALSITGAATPTTVRTVLATSQAPNGAAVEVQNVHPGQSIGIANLTAVGTGASTSGLVSNVPKGTTTVVDSIVSGPAGDFKLASGGNGTISVSYSDFRLAASTGVTDAGHNQSAAPVFAGGGYTEDASSPTVAAGTPLAWQTSSDLAGNSWSAGVGPDMGAYEYVAAAGGGSTGGSTGGAAGGSTGGSAGGSTGGSTGGSAGGSTGGSTGPAGSGSDGAVTPVPSGFPIAEHGPALPPITKPVAGHSVALHPASGVVGVELPHSHVFVALSQASTVPVGSVIDASRGKVLLTSVIGRGGAVKTGAFTGGAFRVGQTAGPRPLTDLTMAGGSFAACTIARGIVHGTRKRRPRVVRQLWGSDSGGRFVTVGRSGSAAVRGTVWLTQDRCDGTYVHVLRGHVVVHDTIDHRNVVLGPGQSYLAPAAG